MHVKKKLIAGVMCLAVVGLMAACAPQELTTNPAKQSEIATDEFGRIGNNIGYAEDGGTYLENYAQYADKLTYADKVAKNAEQNAPEQYTDQFGFTYQPVPSDPKGWNNSYLDADNRGCLSCHDSIEDAVMSLDTKHNAYAMGYPTQLTIANCLGCHRNAGFGNTQLVETLHGIHNGKSQFTAMNGSCDSCHYIDSNAKFNLWDYAKYDLYKGITNVKAADAKLNVSYDQDTISNNDQLFFESLNNEPSEWRTETDPAVADSWVLSIGGEVENPLEMTVTELVEKFGTKSSIQKQSCIENATGNAWIYQAELTGVSMKDVIDYVKPAASVTSLKATSEDGYNMVAPAFTDVNYEDCLLVTEINGQPLPASQGYPLTLAVPRNSAAAYIKTLTSLNFVTDPKFEAKGGVGSPVDPDTKSMQGKPNSAVLNFPDGVVLDGQAGKELTLEGFADAYDEPIKKIEYSLDHGKTWTTLETPSNDPTRWTYWRVKYTPGEAGAYLLKVRTTSTQPDGSDRICSRDTNFLFNVK
ncbi:MAG: molybdopterin-dependent oxidoreductase [Gordonibacter sp.]|uniref:molybdopterin-dependent oxidoreductase n=1 Tax=Gordonibacter sp. TaxID=1968902 RepID=UPI002FC64402